MAVNVFVVAAILGNWWTESNVNPGVWEGLVVGAPGYGLGQWTDLVTETGSVYRRTALFNWLSANGYPQDSGNGQLAFFEHEAYWAPRSDAQYGNLFISLADFLAYVPASPSNAELETLTYAFQQGWEGIPTPQPVRFTNAQNVLDYLIQHGSDPRNPWYSGNRYLSLNEAYSNCLLVYDYFNGYVPPTPPTPTPINKYIIAAIRARIKRKKDDDIPKRKPTAVF